MVTRNQSYSIADAVIARERARSAARWNHRHWAFPELDSFDLERRTQVLRQANGAVLRNWLAHLAALGWIAAYAAAWAFLIPEADKQSAVLVFALGATIPIPFFYAACIRRQVRRIARSVAMAPAPTTVDKL
jgi:hypothetical protein